MLRTSENAVKAEVQLPRNPIPRTPVNKGKKRAEAAMPRPVCYACRYPLEGLTNNLGRGTGCPCGPWHQHPKQPDRPPSSAPSVALPPGPISCGLVVLNSISLVDSLVCAIRFPAKSLSSSVLHDRYGASKNFRMGPLRVSAMLSVLLPQRSGPCGRPAEFVQRIHVSKHEVLA